MKTKFAKLLIKTVSTFRPCFSGVDYCSKPAAVQNPCAFPASWISILDPCLREVNGICPIRNSAA